MKLVHISTRKVQFVSLELLALHEDRVLLSNHKLYRASSGEMIIYLNIKLYFFEFLNASKDRRVLIMLVPQFALH